MEEGNGEEPIGETEERGRVKVYRITPEQLLQVDKYLAETGRY